VGFQFSLLSSQPSGFYHHAAASIRLLTTEWSIVLRVSLSEVTYEIENDAIIDIPYSR
jgi:hypothetical protein